jgi:hypothetical protein
MTQRYYAWTAFLRHRLQTLKRARRLPYNIPCFKVLSRILETIFFFCQQQRAPLRLCVMCWNCLPSACHAPGEFTSLTAYKCRNLNDKVIYRYVYLRRTSYTNVGLCFSTSIPVLLYLTTVVCYLSPFRHAYGLWVCGLRQYDVRADRKWRIRAVR